MELARSRWDVRRFAPVLAPAAIGVAVYALGHAGRAQALWVVAALVAILVVAGVPVERYVARFAARFAHWFGVLATGAVGLLLVGAGVFARLFRSDPLTPRARRGNAWQPAQSVADSTRLASATFGVEHLGTVGGVPTSRPRRIIRGTVLALGSVTLLLSVDLGVGLGWEKITAPDSPVGGVVGAVNFTGRSDTRADSRAQSPAMAAYPWADEYFREIQTTPNSYWPFTESRPLDFQGTYVTIEDWARASYEPSALNDDAPVVWMFGGSTTWGEGQRDGYTIASHLARISEREGSPIRIINYGQRGWTHFQEMILFEQLLAEKPAPDVAIFYDGANEIIAQSLSAKGVPTHTLADQYADQLSGGISEEFAIEDGAAPSEPPSSAVLAWRDYVRHSAIRKVVGGTRDFLDPPAGATVGAGAAPAVRVQEDPGDGQVYEVTIADAERAVDVYERGRELTEYLAESNSVTPIFFWQPVLPGPAAVWTNENTSAPTINISDSLDAHTEVFIDGGHTNEEGARLVAERIWAEIEPEVDSIYADGRGEPAPVDPDSSATTSTPPVRTSAEQIEDAARQLDSVASDPCAVRRWSSQLVGYRAATLQESTALVALTVRFLDLLVASAPNNMSQEVAVVRAGAAELPRIAAAAEVDGARPYLTQLPTTNEPDSPFVLAIQSLVAAGPDGTSCE